MRLTLGELIAKLTVLSIGLSWPVGLILSKDIHFNEVNTYYVTQ